MPNEINYPVQYFCDDSSSHTYKTCIPIREDCTEIPIGGIYLNDPADAWNCNLCGADKEYIQPFLVGDEIHIQSSFVDKYNDDPAAPVVGWDEAVPEFYVRAELLDCDGAVISDDLRDFTTQYITGYANGQSYQSMILDTDAIVNTLGLRYFSIKITSFINVGGSPSADRMIWTEPYALTECKDTVVLEGEYGAYDCLGFYYGTSDEGSYVGTNNFAFRNIRREYATIIDTGGSVDSTLVGDRATQREIIDSYDLRWHECIAPYVKNAIVKQILSSKEVIVDGQSYNFAGTYSNLLAGINISMFLLQVQLERRCTVDFRCG